MRFACGKQLTALLLHFPKPGALSCDATQLLLTERAQFARHFRHHRISFDGFGYWLLERRLSIGEHHFQARCLPIFKNSDVDADDAGNSEQTFVVIRQHGIDVAPRCR